MALIQPDEISSIIKSKIDNYELQTEVSNTGTVLEIAMNLEEDNVGIVILG